jgi:hypothetical protein
MIVELPLGRCLEVGWVGKETSRVAGKPKDEWSGPAWVAAILALILIAVVTLLFVFKHQRDRAQSRLQTETALATRLADELRSGSGASSPEPPQVQSSFYIIPAGGRTKWFMDFVEVGGSSSISMAIWGSGFAPGVEYSLNSGSCSGGHPVFGTNLASPIVDKLGNLYAVVDMNLPIGTPGAWVRLGFPGAKGRSFGGLRSPFDRQRAVVVKSSAPFCG